MSQEWFATIRVSFDEDTNAVQYAESVAVLSGGLAEFLGKIEAHDPQVTMGTSNGRSAEPRAPAGTNGHPSGNGRRRRGPNKPKMQVPAQSLAHDSISVETDE